MVTLLHSYFYPFAACPFDNLKCSTYSSDRMKRRKLSILRNMIIALQSFLRGTVTLTMTELFLCFAPKGSVTWRVCLAARRWLQNQEISHCFLLRWYCQFLTFQQGYFEENTLVFLFMPFAQRRKWNDDKVQVSFRFSAFFILLCLFWWVYKYGHFFLLFFLALSGFH